MANHNHWRHLKKIVVNRLSKVVKWLTGCRFEGHGSQQKCICTEAPTITTHHILICHKFNAAFDYTEEHLTIEKGSLKTSLQLK